MSCRSPFTFGHLTRRPASRPTTDRSFQAFPVPEQYRDLVSRRREGVEKNKNRIDGDDKSSDDKKLTKVLMNVKIERSLGAVQVIRPVDNTVKDLVKVAIDIYVKEKRRPLLKNIDPDGFELHYSQFNFQTINADEKLINLGSRNFFLRSKPSNSTLSDDKSKSIIEQIRAKIIGTIFPYDKVNAPLAVNCERRMTV